MSMTVKQVYEGVLSEMNKVQAPSILLEDFNYFFNKAINQFVNKKYNIYDVNQLTTDDLRVLKSTLILSVSKTSKYGKSSDVCGINSMLGGTYEAYLPLDYLHMLNCICNFKVKKNYKCYDAGTYVQFGATRLTADLWSQVINNFYMRPSYKHPYYYLHNVNVNKIVPTNPYTPYTPEQYILSWISSDEKKYAITCSSENVVLSVDGIADKRDVHFGKVGLTEDNYKTTIDNIFGTNTSKTLYYYSGSTFMLSTTAETGYIEVSVTKTVNETKAGDGTDMYGEFNVVSGGTSDTKVVKQTGTFNLPRTTELADGTTASLVEKPTAQRLANPTRVRIELRCGKDDATFELQNVFIDYIKAPQLIRLTQTQLDTIEDTSQMMEFPDYVCQEIINELTHLLMENASDPRLQSHLPISMSIANPAQTTDDTNANQ